MTDTALKNLTVCPKAGQMATLTVSEIGPWDWTKTKALIITYVCSPHIFKNRKQIYLLSWHNIKLSLSNYRGKQANAALKYFLKYMLTSAAKVSPLSNNTENFHPAGSNPMWLISNGNLWVKHSQLPNMKRQAATTDLMRCVSNVIPLRASVMWCQVRHLIYAVSSAQKCHPASKVTVLLDFDGWTSLQVPMWGKPRLKEISQSPEKPVSFLKIPTFKCYFEDEMT